MTFASGFAAIPPTQLVLVALVALFAALVGGLTPRPSPAASRFSRPRA